MNDYYSDSFKDNEDSLLFTDNLLVLLLHLKDLQDWWKTYCSDNEHKVNYKFIGSCNGLDIKEAAQQIKEDLNLVNGWHNNPELSIFEYIKKAIENQKVLVILDNKNPYNNSLISLDDCRFVALSDKQAPLIYINSENTEESKIFFLLYGATCIWLGIENLNDFSDYLEPIQNKLEAFCQEIIIKILSLKDKAQLVNILTEIAENTKISKKKLKATDKYSSFFLNSIIENVKSKVISYSDASKILKGDCSRKLFKEP